MVYCVDSFQSSSLIINAQWKLILINRETCECSAYLSLNKLQKSVHIVSTA